MKTKTRLMRAAGIIAMLAMAIGIAPAAKAWGPERPTFTNASPAGYAVFNSITDNGGVGDERDFVRIEEKNSGRPYTSDLVIEAGKQYEVYIYYHNDASGTYNTTEGRPGVAWDVRLKTTFPDALAKDEVGAVYGEISAANTNPLAVWDEAYIKAKEAMTLHYVTGSAKIYNDWQASGSVLSMDMFGEGTFLGMNELNGVIWGCDEYSGYITYTIQTVAVETPVVGTDVPDALPETGPAEIFLAVALIIVLVAGIIYYVKTQVAVKKVTKRVKGKK